MKILNRLTKEQRQEAMSLADRLSRETGVVFKVDASAYSKRRSVNRAHILDREDGRLAAAAVLYNWGEDELEGTFVCDNNRLSGMISFALSKMPPRTKRFLAINDRTNEDAAKMIVGEGFAYTGTELQLVLNRERFASVRFDRMETRLAQTSDRALVEAFNRSAWEDYTIAVTDDMLSETVFGMTGGETVAKLMTDANRDLGICGLFGVVVRPDMRGKGYGKAFLGSVIQTLIAKGYTRVHLQVDPDNAAAIRLYGSLGFERECELDYYSKEPH